MDILISILIIVGIFGGIALVFGSLLVIAGKFFAVKTDPRLEKITELLPGGNCGGCGYSGCAAYADAIVNKSEKPSNCVMSSDETLKKISEIMGLEAESKKRMRAQVMCSGTQKYTGDKYKYEGIQDCLFASKIGGGEKECVYGCVGFGSCVKVCPVAAIKVENGVAVVEYEKCVGCGLCVDACPKNIIKLVPFEAKYWVGCRSFDKGQAVRKYCDVGCISCGICVKNCPSGAITITDNVAQINYDLCTECGICYQKCPRHIIWSGALQMSKGDTLEDARKIPTERHSNEDIKVRNISKAENSSPISVKENEETMNALYKDVTEPETTPESDFSFEAKDENK